MRIFDVIVAFALVLAIGFVAEWMLRKDVVAGPATVIDGDTLRLDGQRIRLTGMDAPELAQTCMRDGQSWPCGATARFALVELVQRGDVFCAGSGADAYGRMLARCTVDGVDIAEELVRQGLALADGRYGTAEAEARAARRGLWAGRFERPRDYRAAHPRPD
ncbi:thermonuclease family protein [Xanthobacter agilis]|jgi:endonuclease YncB( thermonuclease family)|uniref:Endonuclease YncB(Thermonuclease family) n=1 Tax=Xanthobacter agilis TaxID=47492 RepID=A0ABU0L9Q7_XANAG|nr:thermonuclease family protein [Xanthobacter agilis]MDQ0503861.1 endonuclease YncB(thermonuclease family) [Xanthobacter agilis]